MILNSQSSYNSADALGIAGIVVAVITAIAGILALFKGWKCWGKRYNSQCDKKICSLYFLINPSILLESLE
jgi:uncharacterized iron-regulated membrane protein